MERYLAAPHDQWVILPAQAPAPLPVRAKRAFTITVTKCRTKPASKPADPAFDNILRSRKFRIGLRYIGD